MPPAIRPPRRLVPILAAWACWLVGVHALIVPCVVGFTLFVLGSEEGWANVLRSGAGMALVALAGVSLGSTVAFLLAGFAFYRGQMRRGRWRIAAACGLAVVAVGLLASR